MTGVPNPELRLLLSGSEITANLGQISEIYTQIQLSNSNCRERGGRPVGIGSPERDIRVVPVSRRILFEGAGRGHRNGKALRRGARGAKLPESGEHPRGRTCEIALSALNRTIPKRSNYP